MQSKSRDRLQSRETRERVVHSGATGASPASIPVPRARTLGQPAVIRPEISKSRRRVLLVAPAFIVTSMFAVFQGSVGLFGVRWGYVVGFLLYWIGWGICFPLWAVGRESVYRMFDNGHPRFGMSARYAIPLLALPPLLGALFIFPMTFPSTSASTLLVFGAIALVNGTVEEILWRGLYAAAFPVRAITGYIMPAAWFAVLQLAALSVYPYEIPGGPATAVIGAFVIGLLYGAIAWRSRSIRWTVLSHVLMNLTGIGAVIYFSV